MAWVLYRVVYAEPDLDGVPPRLRELIGACLAGLDTQLPAARDTSVIPALLSHFHHG